MISTKIEGVEEVRAALDRAATVAKQGGPLQQAVGIVAQRTHAYARDVTHVWTGALRASHTITQTGNHAEIYSHSAVRNPRTRRPPTEYGPYEHARGGEHAFYGRTMARSDTLVAPALAYLRKSLP